MKMSLLPLQICVAFVKVGPSGICATSGGYSGAIAYASVLHAEVEILNMTLVIPRRYVSSLNLMVWLASADVAGATVEKALRSAMKTFVL
jgi:hypothetical protein